MRCWIDDFHGEYVMLKKIHKLTEFKDFFDEEFFNFKKKKFKWSER